ncbi:MAG: BTAD domain-containing putative transcriptional regulator [Gemmatimonadales bacterium]
MPGRRRAARLVLAVALTVAGPAAAQRLVVPIPNEQAVRVVADSFVGGDGRFHRVDRYHPAGPAGVRPAVVFVNLIGPVLRTWSIYQEWARLVTARGMVGVLYDAPAPPADRSREVPLAAADLDSLLATLERRGPRIGIDPGNVVLWAASTNTRLGTPVALESGGRTVRGYVLYYGSGEVSVPRPDVPVFIARAGLDTPGLNRQLDALAARLIGAGLPVTVVNHPSGPHAFDVMDSSAASAGVIEQTLAFIRQVTDPATGESVRRGVPEAVAAAAFAAGRWQDAADGYRRVVAAQPDRGGSFWRLGLAQLELGQHRDALGSFERARDLGVSGARDLGVPAARAAVRAGDPARAAEWIKWALGRFPPLRQEVMADDELGPLLQRPELASPNPA